MPDDHATEGAATGKPITMHIARARIGEASIGTPKFSGGGIFPFGADQQLRLECLRLAIDIAKIIPATEKTSIFDVAQRVEQYVTGVVAKGNTGE